MNPQQQQQHNNQDDHNNNNNNLSSLSPSFNTYNTNIMDTISRVITDIESESEPEPESESEFEFEFEPAYPGSFPVYPVFNRDILRDPGSQEPGVELRKLFLEEDVSPEAYCLWAPRSPETPTRCGSTGTKASATAVSKTWRLRNLLRRCKSDGKEGLMLVADTNAKKKDKEKTSVSVSVSITTPTPTSSPGRGGGTTMRRRKSYLPYKQNLLGFFGSPQTLRKINIPPF